MDNAQSLRQDAFRYHKVEQQIMQMISTGRFSAGDRLPSLRSLATSLGVSISTVNHAYLELERKGIIEARPRSGFFVCEASKPLPTPAIPDSVGAGTEVNRSRLIQTVLGAVGGHDLISYGCVCPDPSLLPGKSLSRIMSDVMRFATERTLAYETIQGSLELRRQIAWRAQEVGQSVTENDIVITSGAMEALYISLRCLTRPGDNVIIQSPTYYCFIQLLENLGLRAIEVPSSPEGGVDPADLHEALDKFDVAACILSPNFNNPDGSLAPTEARKEVVELLARHNVHLVEDDVSGDMHFGPVRPKPYSVDDAHGNVTLCSSFSKTIAPGYRVGWMIPGKLMRKAMEIKATTNVCTATPTQLVIAEFLKQGYFERHVKKLRSTIERQMRTMQHHLANCFPAGTCVTRPGGGSVLWVELPKPANGVDLFFKAKAQGIGIAPGSIFTTRERFENYIRLSCCGVWDERMQNGLVTLGNLAHEALQ